MDFETLSAAIQKYHPEPDLGLVKKAYDFAESSHRGQVRASGEPYFQHLAETALLACQLKVDIPTVCAALLHDTIEDCSITHEELVREFCEEIADIVEGVTKLTRTEFESREERQA
ncbi:MAG: bifunctional (p)ppGpp synthetase/guanosine-3',5'-bis(diphosphate) 3'-pyrophosphohydrolase, partial [Proteobacteria bacterium]|nr:bifunctional (p)ppGpp synthetase/guanosine-3',5'-bis(diphosphate) 3'-pyrophosphohydrolase [Pseudomonadota bacterium]